MQRSPITTHVLDVARGKPAIGIQATLEGQVNGSYEVLATAETDHDGRITTWMPGEKLQAGVYRITFKVDEYQRLHNSGSFYPDITIAFEVKDVAQHYHVPLLLSPFGYSTYRGS